MSKRKANARDFAEASRKKFSNSDDERLADKNYSYLKLNSNENDDVSSSSLSQSDDQMEKKDSYEQSKNQNSDENDDISPTVSYSKKTDSSCSEEESSSCSEKAAFSLPQGEKENEKDDTEDLFPPLVKNQYWIKLLRLLGAQEFRYERRQERKTYCPIRKLRDILIDMENYFRKSENREILSSLPQNSNRQNRYRPHTNSCEEYYPSLTDVKYWITRLNLQKPRSNSREIWRETLSKYLKIITETRRALINTEITKRCIQRALKKRRF